MIDLNEQAITRIRASITHLPDPTLAAVAELVGKAAQQEITADYMPIVSGHINSEIARRRGLFDRHVVEAMCVVRGGWTPDMEPGWD